MAVIRELRAEFTARTANMRAALNDLRTDLNRVRDTTSDTTRNMSKNFTDAGKVMKDAGKTMSKYITVPLTAAGVYAFKAAVDFESAFAGVRKTVDTTEEGFAKLEEGIRQMARELPVSANEIAAVAESAGQLGIAEENILSFTKTIIDMGESTNLTREQAATEFARFANIVQMPQDSFDRLGSSIVELGNNMATTESEIMSMAMRLAGTGAQIGLTEAEIMALSASMSSVGIQAEAGGSAMSTVMKKIQNAVSAGGADLKGFAEAAGMSSSEFATAFEEKPIEAIDAFIKGLAKSSGEGENLNGILDNLGIKGLRESDTLLRLAGASDLLGDAVEMSNSAWEENTALVNEADQRYETMQSKLTVLKNKFVDMAIDFGNIIAPKVMELADKVEGLFNWFKDLSDTNKEIIVWAGAIGAAIGPILVVFGVMASSIGSILGLFSTLTATAPATGAAVGGLAKVFMALTGPVGLTVAAIAAVVAGGVALYTHLQKDSIPAVDRFGDAVSDSTKQALEGFFEMSDKAQTNLTDLRIRGLDVTEEMAEEMVATYQGMHDQILAAMQERHEEELKGTADFFAGSAVLTSDEEAKILANLEEANAKKEETQQYYMDKIAEIYATAAEENREITDREAKTIETINERMNENAVKYLSESAEEQKVILEKMKSEAGKISALQAAEVVKNSAEQRDGTVAEAEATYDDALKYIMYLRDDAGEITAEQADQMIGEAKRSRDETVKYAEDMHEDVVDEAKKQAEGHIEQVDWETGEILSKWDVYKNDVVRKFKETNKESMDDFKRWGTDFNKKSDEIRESILTGFSKWKDGVKERFDKTNKDSLDDFSRWGRNINTKSDEIRTSILKGFSDYKDGVISRFKKTNEESLGDFKRWGGNIKDFATETKDKALKTFTDYKDGVISRFKKTNKDSLDDFKRWGGNIKDFAGETKDKTLNKFTDLKDGTIKRFGDMKDRAGERMSKFKDEVKQTGKDMWKNLTNTFDDMVDSAKALPGKLGAGFRSMSSKAVEGITSMGNAMLRGLGRPVNGAIRGVNWVLDKLNVKTEISTWTVPQYHQGTEGHPGGLAVVGDGKGINAGRELIVTPDGQKYLSPNADTVVDLPRGSQVWSAKDTRSILKNLPYYAKGTGIMGTVHSWAADKLSDLAGGVKKGIAKAFDIFDYLKNPKGLFDAALSAIGVSAPGGSGFVANMAKGGFNKAKSGAISFIKEQMADLGDLFTGGTGQGFGPAFRMTSRYGYRTHPITKVRHLHRGDDYGAPAGTPIPAQADGRVEASGYHSIRGNYVRVKSGNLDRVYQHNTRNLVRVGDIVRKGQPVGTVGTTGSSTGNHLHYEVWRNGTPINPAGYADGGYRIDQAQLAHIAEGGWAESVISYDPQKRAKQKAIWEQTGTDLGFRSGGNADNSAVNYLLERIAKAVEAGMVLNLDGERVAEILKDPLTKLQELDSEVRAIYKI